MQVLLTFDYELFFGTSTGSVEKCLLEPTQKLLDICKKHRIGMTFFVDVGYLIQLENHAEKHPHLLTDLNRIKAQINAMLELSCSIQLHIHPHWEKSIYDGEKWVIQTDGCYKLSDFSTVEAESIIRRYYQYLVNLTRKPITSFRAGGWCIQPFSVFEKTFKELGICIDTSVFPGGKFQSPHYDFDFTAIAPFSPAYRFESDVCTPTTTGFFTEYPIASWYYSPLFYWKLYGMGRLFPSQHKMIGDGNFLAQPGRKKQVLTNRTWNHVSTDGFYAQKLHQQAKHYQQLGLNHFVTIGHPKSATLFSLQKLERFIANNHSRYSFTTFSSVMVDSKNDL